MKFTSVRALFWLADKEARVRISVDAVRGIGPLRMIRREVNGPAVAAEVPCVGHLLGLTVVEGLHLRVSLRYIGLTWRDFRSFMYSDHDSRFSRVGKYIVPQ